MLTEFLDRMQGLLRRKKKAPSPYADYNVRIISSFFDVLFLMGLIELLFPGLIMNKSPTVTLVTMLMMSVISSVVQYFFGTTPGKCIFGIKLVTQNAWKTPSFFRVFFRYIMCIPLMIGMPWITIDKKKRAWHDIASGTVVITLRPDGWYWQQMKRGYRYLRAKISGAPLPANESVTQPPAE